MPPVIECPGVADLRCFALGQLPPERAESIMAHVAGCSACVAALGTLSADDTLSDAVRASATLGERPEQDVVSALASHVKALAPTFANREDDATVSTVKSLEDDLAAVLAPAQSADEIGRLGGYRVLKLLGSGGMGAVFLAEDERLGRHVALKVMRPALASNAGARQRFSREAKATAAIKDDHIITIHQVSEERGIPFLAMEFLQGEALDTWLARVGVAPAVEVLRIGQGVARGLSAAHERGLIHRDVKPANLWLEPSGRVKLLDFGLARCAADDTQLTKSGAIVGTPAYMAPEQARGETVDARSDLFSLGCVLYRLSSGQPPFRGETTMSLLTALALEVPVPPHEVDARVPVGLSDLIMRLLAKDPAARPDTARAVLAELQALEQALTAPAAPAVKAVPPRRRRRVGWLVAAAVLLAALVPAGWYLGPTVVRFATNQGVVVIESDDKDVEVTVKDGTGKIYDRVGKSEIVVAAGEGQVSVTVKGPQGEMHFVTKEYVLKRGGRAIVNVRAELAKAKERQDKGTTVAKDASLKLDPAKIPASERFAWQPKELVAVLGEHRARHWGYAVVAFSPDGKMIASAAQKDRYVRLWDAATMKLKAEFQAADTTSLAFSPDGKTLACGCDQHHGTALWDVSKEIPRRRATVSPLNYGVFSADGKMVAGPYEDKILIFDVTTDEPKELHTIKLSFQSNSRDIVFSKDGKTLGSACGDSVIRFWDISGAKVKELPPLPKQQGEAFPPRLLTARLTGEVVALTFRQTGIIVWDVNGAECKKREKTVPYQSFLVTLAGDGKTLVQWNWDAMHIYDLSEEKATERMSIKIPARHYQYGAHPVVAVSSDGKSLVAGHFDGAVTLWNVAGDKPKELHANPGRTSPFSVCLSKDGSTLAVADPGAVSLWDLSGSEPKAGPVLKQEGVNSVAFSADGKTLTIAGGRAVVLWDLTKKEPVEKAVLDGGNGAVGEILLFLSRDGKLVGRVTRGEKADRLEVLDVAGDRLKQRAAVFESSTKLHGLAFSPDGKTVVASCGDGKARLWDVTASATVKPTEIAGGTGSVRFSEDGKFLLASSLTRVWHLLRDTAGRQ